MLWMSRLGCGGRWLVALDRHKQEVGVLKVAQELHGISLLSLDHHLLSEKLIELGIEKHFSLLGRRVHLIMDSLLLSNLLKHLPTERFECEVSVVAQLQEIRLEEVAIEAATATAQVQDTALERVPARIKDSHREGIQMHFLLV